MPHIDKAPERHPQVAHEPNRVSVKAILWFGFALFAAAVVVHVGLWGLFRLFAADVRKEQPSVAPSVASSLNRTPSEPRLEPLPLAPGRRLRTDEDSTLTGYAWVNRPGGVARIPIARAMEIIARSGVPGGKPLPPPATSAPAAGPRQ